MKRVVSLLLAFLMSLSMLVGCGGNDDIPDGTVTLKVGIPQNSVVTSYKNNAFTSYLEEQGNVKIDFVYFSGTTSEAKQQLALMCGANQELPDVLVGMDLGHYVMNQYGEDGYFLDLTDLIEDYAPNYKAAVQKFKEEDDLELGTYIEEKGRNTNNGALYGMPQALCTASDDRLCDSWINKVWLDNLGLEVPTTVDELTAVLKAFKTQDPNRNGKADEIPMLGTAMQNYLINAFVWYEGEFNVTDGTVWDPTLTDEFRQALIYANDLVKQELYSSLSFTVTSDSEQKNLISPANGEAQVGVFAGYTFKLTNATTDHISEYIALPPLEDATGQGGYTMVSERYIKWKGFITKDCEYPAVAMKFLDLFYMDETITRQRHGEKGVDWEYVEGKSAGGFDAYTKVINTEAFFSGSSTWCSNVLGIMTHWNYLQIQGDAETTRTIATQRQADEAWEIISTGRQPEERCNYLVYTQEEYEIREDLAGTKNSYVNEQITAFISGEKDPRSNAQWNEFLQTQEELGRTTLMEVAQSAYNRK